MGIKYTLEDVEYLRSKAGIGYEEAVSLLEKYDGDMTRALVELEKRGKLGGDGPKKSAGGFWSGLTRLISMSISTRVVITRKENLLANLPVLYPIAATILAPWVTAFTLILMLVTGCRLVIRKGKGKYTENDIRRFVNQAADNIKESVSSFSITEDGPEGEENTSSEEDAPSGEAGPIPTPTRVEEDAQDQDGYDEITVD